MGRLKHKRFAQDSSESEEEGGHRAPSIPPAAAPGKGKGRTTGPVVMTPSDPPSSTKPAAFKRLRKAASSSDEEGGEDKKEEETAAPFKRLRRDASSSSSSSPPPPADGDMAYSTPQKKGSRKKPPPTDDQDDRSSSSTPHSARKRLRRRTTASSSDGDDNEEEEEGSGDARGGVMTAEEEGKVAQSQSSTLQTTQEEVWTQPSPQDIKLKMQQLAEKRRRQKLGGRGAWAMEEGYGMGEAAQEEEEEYYDEEEGEEGDGFDSDFIAEEGEVMEEQVIACKCGATEEGEEEEVLWIQCKNPCCEAWSHARCYGIATDDEVPKRFQCAKCDPEGLSRASLRTRAPLTPEQEKEAKKKRRLLLYEEEPAIEMYDLLREPGWGEERGAAWRRFMGLFEKLGVQRLVRPVGEFKRSGETLLMRAAALGRVAAVEWLLDAGANALQVDKNKKGVVQYAAEAAESQVEVMELVVDSIKKKKGVAALKEAITAVDHQGRNLFHWAAYGQTQASTFPFLWRLFSEAGVKKPQVDKMLKHQSEEVDNFTPLLVACDAENREAIVALVDRYPQALEIQSSLGVNPLMVAISKGMLDMVKVILKHATHTMMFQTDDEQSSCLHYAAGSSSDDAAEICRLLLDTAPGLINLQDKDGTSSLHQAACSGTSDTVTVLLSRDARVDVVDHSGWTPLLYANFQDNSDCVTVLLSVDPEGQLIILGRLLKGDRRNDARVVKVLRGLVIIPSCLRTINLFVSRNIRLLDASLDFMLHNPALLDFANKISYLRMKLASGPLALAYDYGNALRLPRTHCWSFLCKRIISGQVDPHLPLSFEFSDSVAMGPGVQREVLEVLARDLASQHQGDEPLFQLAADGMSYEPRPFDWLSDMYRRFQSAGQLFGHCIRYSKLLSINLNSCFLKLFLHHPVTMTDLRDLDEVFHGSLSYILESDDVEALDLTFSTTAEDKKSDIPLCEGGLTKVVTKENREEYVSLMVQHHTKGRMGNQSEALRAGLLDVLGDETLLGLFTPSEFSTLLGGVHAIDVDDWKTHCTLDGYDPGSPVVRWFWQFVRSLPEQERSLLLKFATGTSRVPVGGFAAMSPPFTITRMEFSPMAPISTAATCFHQLKLQAYSSYRDLEKNLLLAIRFGCEGFTFV